MVKAKRITINFVFIDMKTSYTGQKIIFILAYNKFARKTIVFILKYIDLSE